MKLIKNLIIKAFINVMIFVYTIEAKYEQYLVKKKCGEKETNE